MAKGLRKHLHRRIVVQITIIAVVALILAGAVIRDALLGDVGVLPMIVAAAVGLGIGYLTGRMFLLTWHEDTRQVVMRMDRLGFVLIGAYVLFRIFSAQLLGDYFNGVALSAISFAVLDGILVGRLVSMGRNIGRILREQGITK